MRRALPMLLGILALMIPHEAAAAEIGGRDTGATPPAFSGDPSAPAPAIGQRSGRVGPPQQGRQGRGRGRQVAKGNKRGKGRANVGRVGRHAPYPRVVVAPRRAPVRYATPYRDIRRTYTRRSGLAVSVLYSGDWGGVHVEFGRPVPQTVYVVPAPVAVLPPPRLRRPRSIHIPPGHLPPPGWCRVWFADSPPGHQPPPTDCASAYRYAPPEAFIIYGG